MWTIGLWADNDLLDVEFALQAHADCRAGGAHGAVLLDNGDAHALPLGQFTLRNAASGLLG